MNKHILTIGGSTSKNSISKKLAEYTATLLSNVTITNIDLNDYLMPLFSVDEEVEKGFPTTVIDLNNLLNEADGFIVALAEHNGAYSAAFKNMFDWLSRIDAKVWRDKPLLLLSSSTGSRGGASVLEIAKNRFPYHNAKITGTMTFPNFFENFKNGTVINKNLKAELVNQVNLFAKDI